MTASPTLKWTPWGGVGEIGMNCMVLEFGSHAVPVDAGIMFADANDYGVEAIFADFEQLITKHRPKEWIITHVHEDHIGAVPYIFLCANSLGIEPPVIYAPPLAAAAIKEKIKDVLPFRLHDNIQKIVSVPVGDSITIGDLEVTFVGVSHSAPQSTALVFKWQVPGRSDPVKVFHTGDFKKDDFQSQQGLVFDERWKNFEPDVMFVDSTNSNRKGRSISETEILEPLCKLIESCPGRVFLTLFSSNVERVLALSKIARQTNRKMALAGRSLQTMMRLAGEVGFYQSSDYAPECLCDVSELKNLDDSRQIVVCSGSQGELRSVLARMANGSHQEFYVKETDTIVFSSKMIPGNEKSIYRLINRLISQGATVLWDEAHSDIWGPLHASGHGRREEISDLIAWVQPKALIPVHGNVFQMKEVEKIAIELKRSGTLKNTDVIGAENGDSLEFALDVSCLLPAVKKQWVEFVPKYLRFDGFVAPSLDPFLRIRKKAALGGVVSIVIDQGGRFKTKIDGVTPGLGPNKDLVEKTQRVVDDFCHSTYKKLIKNWPIGLSLEKAEQEYADNLSRDLRKLLGVKSFVVLHLVRL